MSGFIALHRDAFLHPLLKDAKRFRAWFWLVAQASWKRRQTDFRGNLITLERGQLYVSRAMLAREWGWSPSAIERFLVRLKIEHMIEQKTGQGGTIITICNYDKYQENEIQPDNQPDNQPDRNRTETGQQQNKGNKGNKAKEESGGGARPRAAVRNYAFCGRVIRLTQSDFDAWEKSFHAIPDLRGELAALDAWFSDKPPSDQKRWFYRVPQSLNRKHQEILSAAKAAAHIAKDPAMPDYA